MTSDFDVCIVGAGPTGLTLALELSRRGVSSVLVERNLAPGPWPKMERCNARTMEIFRRLGLADTIRAAAHPPDGSMDIAIVSNLCDPPLAVLKYPTVRQLRERIAECSDGSLPLEPYQVVSQYTLEPILRAAVARCANVTTRYGATAESFEERQDCIELRVQGADGPAAIRARYLVGCDGGGSTIRKQLDIKLEGRGNIAKLRQVFFRCADLFQKTRVHRARHYWFADPHGSFFVVQDDGVHFTLHSTLPREADFAAAIRSLAGCDIEVEVLHVNEWTMHLLVAESYGRGRVFIAGDAAHLVIPAGGLGMNTGVGDAVDLAWKLAGAVQGWGGPALLASYETERKAVGRRNRDASGFGTAGLLIWRSAFRPNIREDSADGAATRAQVAQLANVAQRRNHEMAGVELGYSYAGSPIVCAEPGPSHESDYFHYIPSASPGSRLPHAWLSDGRAIQDVIGVGYTLLDFSQHGDTKSLQVAMRALGAPLDVVRLDEPQAHRVCGRRLVLLRPDAHVAWRGDELPANCAPIARAVTGNVTEAVSV
jgi:2-polyprenyl-6-methoxyphenol hydroxylase-like FAD-dependent oxidoreductase